MLNIFYPLVKSTIGDCEEFKYSLRSLETNLTVPYRVIVVGEYIPKWLDTTKVTFIYRKREPLRYTDSVTKLVTVCNIFDDFIWMHDDMFLLKPIGNEIKDRYHLSDLAHVKKFGNLFYQRRLKEIYETNSSNGKPTINYATHTPMYFKSSELLATIDKYNFMEDPKLYIETVHYNDYVQPSNAVSSIKVGRYNSNILRGIGTDMVFANFDENGIKSGIFDILKKIFLNKSNYEL